MSESYDIESMPHLNNMLYFVDTAGSGAQISLRDAYRRMLLRGNLEVLCIWNFAWAPVRKQDAKRIPRKLKKKAPWLRT